MSEVSIVSIFNLVKLSLFHDNDDRCVREFMSIFFKHFILSSYYHIERSKRSHPFTVLIGFT